LKPVLTAAVVAALVLSTCATGALAHAAGHAAARPSVEALIMDSLRAYHDRSSPGDDQYYANGRWYTGDEGYWPAQTGPATAAATLYTTTHEPWLAKLAVATIDRGIRRHQERNGAYGGTPGLDIATMVFASELGRSYLALGAALPRGTGERWRSSLRRAADFLIKNGNLAWYTNGNIVLGNAEVMALAYRVTGDVRYRSAYATALAFATAPPQARWPGFGLHLTKTPTRADGADGAGYLSEAGPDRVPGFDVEYTYVQLDVASRLFLLMRDAQTLRLTNELANTVLSRVDHRTWLLDTSGGSRHPDLGRKVPLTTPALSVLAWQGGRSDLARYVDSQLAVVDETYRSALTFSYRNFYRGLGDQLPPILQATFDHR
jgi:hypothetical protein